MPVGRPSLEPAGTQLLLFETPPWETITEIGKLRNENHFPAAAGLKSRIITTAASSGKAEIDNRAVGRP